MARRTPEHRVPIIRCTTAAAAVLCEDPLAPGFQHFAFCHNATQHSVRVGLNQCQTLQWRSTCRDATSREGGNPVDGAESRLRKTLALYGILAYLVINSIAVRAH